MNCSEYHPDRCWKGTFWYTPGAADDHELWGRKLIPRLFWENMNEILMEPLIDEEVEATIDRIVAADALMEANNTNNDTVTDLQGDFDAIGEETGIYIGTRRAGRPPQCWKTFDAIVNVTDMEYPDFTDNLPLPEGKWYLQLPVKEGKREKTELERWMPVAIIFCLSHLQSKRRVLIHCAQGKDRSVAIAMAVMMLSCELHYPLQCRKDLGRLSLEDLLDSQTNVTFDDDDTLYHYSGLTTRLVDTLLDRQGGTIVLDWYHSMMGLADEVSLATKETIRIALHLIQQYREKADPTRSTMQKLHRFFMSSPHLPNP
jgi:tRNA A64-2'-O-ribosylphosphate transferase